MYLWRCCIFKTTLHNGSDRVLASYPVWPLSPHIPPQPQRTPGRSGCRTRGAECQQVPALTHRGLSPLHFTVHILQYLHPCMWRLGVPDPPSGESQDMGEKLRWHRSMETAKSHQLLRPCFEQRVGPDGFQIVPNCEVSSQGETKPRLLQAASVWRKEYWRQIPRTSWGGLQGRGMLHCKPSQEEAEPLPSGVVGSRNSRGRMELARPHLAALFFGQGSAAGPKSFCRHGRKGQVKELWHRAALQARLIRSRTSVLWMIFWQGTRASFC